ncbi:hypothetical protein HF086_014289 [Spodoptera exigua]|uniref:FLYWCH-type domain-containing protein n=1 Tax=Spodoptera exigua TaxID=7107 RepID=A0A922SBP9_SPOEX|nr:hypothetical protein HF086_014289 [Spodoptera exigua]
MFSPFSPPLKFVIIFASSRLQYRNILSRYLLTVKGEYEIIKMHNTNLILYDGYTFSHRGSSYYRNYYCSQKISKKCKAKLKIAKDGTLEWVYNMHTHDRPMINRKDVKKP